MIDKLRTDYYSVKEYLSNSDIDALLKNPSMFKKDKPQTPEMLNGSYYHSLLIEPDKLGEFVFCDASTRNTNKYKELGQMALLTSEKEEIESMVSAFKQNYELYEMVYDDVIAYEEPAIGEIMGYTWKGKADIVKPSMVVDLKTTSDLDRFKYSANDYNYDSQAYIYNHLFGREVVFVVQEKGSNRVMIVDCSEEFLDRGKEKVKRALENYKRFFVDGEDIAQNIIKLRL
jgi:hypothetical protein